MKKPTRRQVIWGAVLLGVVVLIALAMMPRPVEVDVARVERGELVVTVDEEGETRVRDRFVVSSPLAGKVLRIDLDPGDRVEEGERVAVVRPADPALLDVRSRREAEAVAAAARAGLERARAQLDQAEAERALAASELARSRRLAEEEIVSQERLEQAETEARSRQEAVRAARSTVASARQELAAAEARLMQGRGGESADDPVAVESPIAGVVLRRLRESEAVVPAGEPLLEVADPADLEIVADLLSRDAVRVDVGDAVLIEQWGGDARLRGTVRRVEPAGFTKVSALGVEEQRVNVVVDFADPHAAWQQLGDAFRVELRIVVWQGDDVVKAPTSALFRRPPGMEDGEPAEGEGAAIDDEAPGTPSGEPWAVFVVEDGHAALRPVTIGRKNGLEAQVLAGLDPGDTVIVHPADTITDGSEVMERRGAP